MKTLLLLFVDIDGLFGLALGIAVFNVIVMVLPSFEMEVVPRTAIMPSRVRTKDSEYASIT